MAAADALDGLLDRLARQHREVLERVAGEALRAAQSENRRLSGQLAAASRTPLACPQTSPALACSDACVVAGIRVTNVDADDVPAGGGASVSSSPARAWASPAPSPANDVVGSLKAALVTTAPPSPLPLGGALTPPLAGEAPVAATLRAAASHAVPASTPEETSGEAMVIRETSTLKFGDSLLHPNRDGSAWWSAAAPKSEDAAPALKKPTLLQLPGMVGDQEHQIVGKLESDQSTVHGRTSSGWGFNTASIDAMGQGLCSVEGINQKVKLKQRRRLHSLLEVGADRRVRAETLFKILTQRAPEARIEESDVEEVLGELRRVYDEVTAIQESSPTHSLVRPAESIKFGKLLDVLFLPDLLERVEPGQRRHTKLLHRLLLTTTVDEVIASATKASPVAIDASAVVRSTRKWEVCLNTIVSFTVVFNILVMGISIDAEPDHIGWLCIEIACVVIFLFELIVKLSAWGYGKYFCGDAMHWNILDFIITVASVFDVSLNVAQRLDPSYDGAIGSAARVTVTLRTLRMVRVVRMVKLLRTPFLRELANMLVGFIIGIPALFWVLVLFIIVLFVMGLLFRIILGPSAGQDQISECGFGDNFVADPSRPNCKLEWMYGEEFFGSLPLSMFTTFRFMIGDFSTVGGKSLAVAFSQGYGVSFHVLFVVGMIVVIFGLFNIITAIFVDSTISGLKHSHNKRKYAVKYEGRFVKDKLTLLLRRIAILIELREKEQGRCRKSVSFMSDGPSKKLSKARRSIGKLVFGFDAEEDEIEPSNIDKLELQEEDFVDILEDDAVRMLLVELDIDIQNPSGLFDAFDPDQSGKITVPQLVQALVKMRGEPQKNDLVASWVAIRSLHEKIDSVSMVLSDALKDRHRPSLLMSRNSNAAPSAAPGGAALDGGYEDVGDGFGACGNSQVETRMDPKPGHSSLMLG